MIQALHTGGMGLLANQFRLDVIANNFANVNTNGYKSSRADFKDALYQTMQRPMQPQDELNLELGHGVLVSATTRVLKQGALLETGRATDFGLNGEGFFAVRDAEGNTLYTRDGNFHISHERDGDYLVTHDGMYVLDIEGRAVMMPPDTSNFTVSSDGTISEVYGHRIVQLDSEAEDDRYVPPEELGKLGIYQFPTAEGLAAAGGNCFAETDNSGGAARALNTEVRQGYVEASTTDIANEMTQMILAQRAYQFSARVVSTADQMEGVANSLRK